MKNDLSAEQLRQAVTVTLPLSAVLKLAELEARPHAPIAAKLYERAGFDALPAIGAEFSGGKFAGVSLENSRPVVLVKLEGEFTGTHEQCIEWAKQKGGTLPNRVDGIVLFDNLKADFKQEYYWLEPLRAGDPDCAWVQGFDDGGQGWYRRSFPCPAVAVRRLAIQ